MKEGLLQATLGRKKLDVSRLELSRHVFVEFLVGNVVELHIPSLVSEGWYQLTSVLSFGVLKRIRIPYSLLNSILGFLSR